MKTFNKHKSSYIYWKSQSTLCLTVPTKYCFDPHGSKVLSIAFLAFALRNQFSTLSDHKMISHTFSAMVDYVLWRAPNTDFLHLICKNLISESKEKSSCCDLFACRFMINLCPLPGEGENSLPLWPWVSKYKCGWNCLHCPQPPLSFTKRRHQTNMHTQTFLSFR